MDHHEIQSILQSMGERVLSGSQLILIGGGALALLGSRRLTIDIDFIGDDIDPNALHRSIMEIAKELRIHAEPVPLERFIPVPQGSENAIFGLGDLEIWKSM